MVHIITKIENRTYKPFNSLTSEEFLIEVCKYALDP